MSDWGIKWVFYKEESTGQSCELCWAAGEGGAARAGRWAAHSENRPESQAMPREGILCSWPPRDKGNRRPDEEQDILTYVLACHLASKGREKEGGPKRKAAGGKGRREEGEEGEAEKAIVIVLAGNRSPSSWVTGEPEAGTIDKVCKGWGKPRRGGGCCSPEVVTAGKLFPCPGRKGPPPKTSHRK